MKRLFGGSWRAHNRGGVEIFLAMNRRYEGTFFSPLHLWNRTVKILSYMRYFGVPWFMNEKTLIIALFAILGIGFVGILFVVFPWIFSHGFSNWAQVLIDDGLIIVCLIMFVYGFYMNTRMHWINIVPGWTSCPISQWKLLWAPYFSVEQPK